MGYFFILIVEHGESQAARARKYSKLSKESTNCFSARVDFDRGQKEGQPIWFWVKAAP